MAVLKAPPKQPRTTVVQLRLDDEAKTLRGMQSSSIAHHPTS